MARPYTKLLLFVLFLGNSAAGTHADFRFSVDSITAEFDLVLDMQDGRASTEHFTQEGYRQVHEYLSGLPSEIRDVLTSALLEVCPLMSISGSSGTQYSFRSNHAAGEIDWLIWLDRTHREKVHGVALCLPSGGDSLGQPCILPALPAGGKIEDLVVPSSQMQCMSPEDRVAAQEEVARACSELGIHCELLQDQLGE